VLQIIFIREVVLLLVLEPVSIFWFLMLGVLSHFKTDSSGCAQGEFHYASHHELFRSMTMLLGLSKPVNSQKNKVKHHTR